MLQPEQGRTPGQKKISTLFRRNPVVTREQSSAAGAGDGLPVRTALAEPGVLGLSIGADGPDSGGPSLDRPRRYNDQNMIKYEEYLN